MKSCRMNRVSQGLAGGGDSPEKEYQLPRRSPSVRWVGTQLWDVSSQHFWQQWKAGFSPEGRMRAAHYSTRRSIYLGRQSIWKLLKWKQFAICTHEHTEYLAYNPTRDPHCVLDKIQPSREPFGSIPNLIPICVPGLIFCHTPSLRAPFAAAGPDVVSC